MWKIALRNAFATILVQLRDPSEASELVADSRLYPEALTTQQISLEKPLETCVCAQQGVRRRQNALLLARLPTLKLGSKEG